jgi:hypothetical protein
MSTHSHEVITDVRGELSLFLQTFHRHMALCVKAIRGWPGEVFDKRSTGAHELLTPEATIGPFTAGMGRLKEVKEAQRARRHALTVHSLGANLGRIFSTADSVE